jgi:CBS-domain-containing membrane protein
MAITAMQFTGTVHPPAAANPLLVILTHAGWSFLGLPVLAGVMMLVVLACLYHRFISGREYPT